MLSHETPSRYPYQTEAVEALLASLENMDDYVVLDLMACDFPVTTDPAIVRQFLERHSRGVQLVFCTYHSSVVLAEGIQGTEGGG